MAMRKIYFTKSIAINTSSDYLQDYGDIKLTHRHT